MSIGSKVIAATLAAAFVSLALVVPSAAAPMGTARTIAASHPLPIPASVPRGDPVRDDIAFLTHLALVVGHLDVAVDLYRQGHAEAARTHMKHPGDELLGKLETAFLARKIAGFVRQLSDLANAVDGGSTVEVVNSRYQAVTAAVAMAHKAFGPVGLRKELQVVAALVRESSVEFAVGVADGRVVNAHEYQDALGFARAARELLAQLDPRDRADDPQAVSAIEREVVGMMAHWPSVVPPERLGREASTLREVADRIERAVAAIR